MSAKRYAKVAKMNGQPVVPTCPRRPHLSEASINIHCILYSIRTIVELYMYALYGVCDPAICS